MKVGNFDMIYYWRICSVWFGTMFLWTYLTALGVLGTSELEEIGFFELTFSLFPSLFITMAVALLGSVVWWPMVVFWHWLVYRLKQSSLSLPNAAALSSAVVFIVFVSLYSFFFGLPHKASGTQAAMFFILLPVTAGMLSWLAFLKVRGGQA